MKRGIFLLSVIFALTGGFAHGQIVEMYNQGFEGSGGSGYALSPTDNGTIVTDLAASGSSSIKLVQSTTDDVELILDTLDFSLTQNLSLSYIAMEFDHINNIATNPGSSGMNIGQIYIKRANQSAWTLVSGDVSNYDRTGEYSTQFGGTSTFNKNSYSNWLNTTMTNNHWHHERFNFNAILANVAAADRKVLIKFVLKPSLLPAGPGNTGWWIDNLRIRASQEPMVKPMLKMAAWPDGGAYPNSRGARVELETRTTVQQGMCADSIYLIYTVGSDPTQYRLTMSPMGSKVSYADNETWYRYGTVIPFEGYDTLMRFYCVVKDNTVNHNEATYPTADGGWVDFWFTRGTEQPGIEQPNMVGTSNYTYFPFPADACNIAEWVYDSAYMAEAGYGPGAITDLRFTVGANSQGATREKFSFRVKNAPTSYVANSSAYNFSDDVQTVLDTTLTLPTMSAGAEFTIHLQDTIYYAGKDLIVQSVYFGTTNPCCATSIKMVPSSNNKMSFFCFGLDAQFGINPYASVAGQERERQAKRPAIVMTQHANKPLIYDMGISRLVHPTYTNPLVNQTETLQAKLTNYGVSTINAVRVSWTIDDTIFGYTDWTGSLAGGDSATINIGSISDLPAGYHYLRAWVEDTLTINAATTMLKRDHEPFNDTAYTEFIMCEGALSGVRQIGGEDADYNNIEEFLFSLSRCGIDDSLVVKLAPGQYPPFSMTNVNGLSEQNYIVYESLDPENRATLYADASTGTSQIVDISSLGNIRFRNLDFVRRAGSLTNMVAMSAASDNCHFEGCTFIDSLDNPSAAMRIAAMIGTNYADNTLVEGCTFEGALVGVALQGQAPTMRSTGNTVRRSIFRNQYNKAIDVENQTNVSIDHNEMYDVLSNNSYVMQLLHVYGTVVVTGNRILTTNGAGAIGISDMHGSEADHAIVANNMIVCNDVAGNHTLTTPLNVIKAEWTDVVYNSVKLTATSRTNVAATTFGGTLIEHCRFVNNIVACMDNRNYALNYMPGNQTTNTVGYNVYYSMGATLNRRTGTSYGTLDLWKQAVTADSMSISANPVFLTGSLVDLRTFNRQLKGIGTPIAQVTVDIFDTVRSATTPCPGAFEFSSLPYDFEVEAMVSPVDATCNMPESVELMVRLRNGGTSQYNPDSTVALNMSYTINGGEVHTFVVPQMVPAEDTVTVHTGQMLSLPPDGIHDATYDIKVWLTCANDPNQTNDTNSFRSVSRYQVTPPDDVEVSTLYMTPATVTVSEGVINWDVYADAAAPKVPSVIYWYYDPDDEEPFQVGNTLVTTELREDTHFYVKQQREVPMVRITQVMVKAANNNNVSGLVTPLPEWMNSGTQVAVQLTNIGDDTAFLAGDTLRVVSPTSTYNNKGTLKFGNNVTLAPGEAIVVQYITGNSTNAAKTVHTGTKITPANTADLGFIYRHGTVIDAVAINNVVSTNSTQSVKWSNQNVPSYVWSGTQGVSAPTGNTAAGFVRVDFNGNASDWVLASDSRPIDLGSVNPDWMRYTNNGCAGGAALVNVTISNKPTSDIALEAYPLASGCGLGVEPLTVHVRNYGDSAVAALQLNYTLGGDTVSEVFTSPMPAHGDTTFTFAQSPNLAFDVDSNVNVTIWATMTEGDIMQNNDTAWVSTVSLNTLGAPEINDTIETQYGETAEITFDFPTNVMPVWYNYNMEPVDTGYVYETDILYTEGNLGISYIIRQDVSGRIGNGTSLSSKTAYPSPFQPNNRFVKQQYIYSAYELRSIGLDEGQISRIAFHLDSIWGTRDSVLFDQYYISMGMTQDSIFASASAWKATTIVKQIDSLVLYRSDVHDWVWFDLDNPITWDGVSNLVVQVAYANSASVTTGVQTSYTTKSNTTLHKVSNNANDLNPSVYEFAGSGGTKGNNRPNIMFDGSAYGCNGPITTIPVSLLDVPEYDATIYWPDGFDTTVFTSCVYAQPQIAVFNLGSEPMTEYDLHYWIDDDTIGSTTHVTQAIAGGTIDTVSLFNLLVQPGRHMLRAVVESAGDTISRNDTVVGMITVRFCSGTYTIAADSTGDFVSFGAAVDTLNTVGTTGGLTFFVQPGVYNEQVSLNAAPGLNGISFIGQGSEDNEVRLVGNTSVANNYVFKIDGVDNVYITGLRMESHPQVASVKAANVFVVDNCNNITLNGNRFRVKGTINDANASCMVLGDSVNNVGIVNNTFDSGFCSIKTTGSGYTNFTITDNTFSLFQSKGIDVSNVSFMTVNGNDIRSGASADAKGLIGVNLSYIDSSLSIQNNKIYLIDDHTGAKRGIHLEHVSGTDMNPVFIANNMIGLHGTGAAGLTPKNPSGIYIDNACSYINVYFNTVRVYAGATQNDTRAFFSGATNSDLQVKSNIFANFSNAYAYYVGGANSIIMSDYNGYYSGGSKFAYWGADRASLSALQNANSMDENSVQDMPYFTANDDLHLLMTNFCARAQYDPDVMYDIDGNPRPPIPAPTIGAHELERFTRNMTVVQISQPTVPLNLNNPTNIEGDAILVTASFYNNGSSTENNVTWKAYIDGYETEMCSNIRSLGTFNPAQMKTDTVYIPTILGVIDTQSVRVVVYSDGDEDLSDNELTTDVYLAPAFNLEAVKMQSGSTGCELKNAAISITVKNVGFKAIPASQQMQISYVAQGYHPSFIANNPDSNKLAIATMPTTPVTETVTFETDLPKNQTRAFTFNTPANLYPTDTSLNIKVRIKGWFHFQYDIINGNDSTGPGTAASPVIDAYYTPRPPVGHDTTFNYGTWGEVHAEQENSRPIRWYRDSTATPFYTTTGANAYANSCWWRTTPQYFHDSTYYLMCYSDKNCPSNFSEVHVHVPTTRFTNDIAIEEVLAPLGGHVYMENDTVRIRIANYGTASQSNFPVTYAVRKGNNTNPFQTVTETVTATVGPNQTYIYTFDSLIYFSNTSPATSPTAGGTYQVRAWTDLVNDQSRRNDTIRTKQILRPSSNNDTQLDYAFSAKPESTYPTRTNTASDSVDIIRFSFNEIDVDLPALGRSYSNFGIFTNPEIPVLHVTKGMTDSVFMMITNPTNNNAVERGRIAVYIDFNRNGSFNDPGECVIPDTNLWNNTLYRGQISIPNDASYGYMKMRVSASPFNKPPSVTLTGQDGHMLDFLLFVDQSAPAKDLAITQIAEPRDYLIRDNLAKTVSFRIANRGASAINAADIYYSFTPDTVENAVSGVINWTGNLQPGRSALVELPQHAFPYGTTTVTIWHNLDGDAVNTNNSLSYEYHRFHTVILALDDNFDEDLTMWYAPSGNNGYNRNYWQRGTPTKQYINQPYSAPNAWVTDLSGTVQSGLRGNISYLYSPIINTASIRPDTLSFRMMRRLTGGSKMYIEYRDYLNEWSRLASDTTDPPSWYNNTDNKCFDGNSNGYTYYYFPCSLESGNFHELLQFRIVYITPQGSSATSSYGEGCAIDNIRIGRARKPKDVGVIAITQPTAPRYGQTIYPEVVVKNYGTDTIDRLQLGYIHYGTFLAKESIFDGLSLPPDGIDTFLFDSPFVITSDYPDTFSITAFTIYTADIYKDNDTASKQFHLLPLDDDIAADRFVTPLDRVIAGDSITVTMRVFNFGTNPIASASFSYIVSGRERVDEEVVFEDVLGHQLGADEYFNYTFRQKFRASMGIMSVTGIVKSSSNEYIYNDTIIKRFTGISSIMDLAAAAIVIDTMSSYTDVRVSLVVDNRGARGANDFEVGFWVDDDTANVYRETYHTHNPLPALSRGYHLFETVLPPRATPYDHITAFVNIENDNDLSNDTTTDFIAQSIDVEALGILVEENSAADCRTFIQLRNIGNMALVGATMHITGSVNGNDIGFDLARRLDPMEVATIQLERNLPKSPTRQYSGSFSIDVSGDANIDNNQTSIVRVVNYVEGMPTVNDAAQLVLEQNFPNPFSQQTTVPFSLPQAANVRFFVMDATGHIVNSFAGFYPAGANSITLDMQAYSAGIYYYGIEVDGERQMRKMIIR